MVTRCGFWFTRMCHSVGLSRSSWRFCRDVLTDRRGAVAVVFALALIPLCMAGGAAIDMGRAYLVKSRLGYALDAAGLAVGASSITDEAELEELMEAFFEANYPANEVGVAATPEMTLTDDEIELEATATINTTLMSIVGIDTLTVSASTVIVRETKGLEVVLVLDNTGSMGTTKMNSLKTASRTFVDILFGDSTENELLLVGIVPFAAAVNVGDDFAHLNDAFDEDDFDPFDWEGCVMARGGNRDRTDVPPTSNNRRWEAFLWPDDRNNNWSGYNTSRWATPNRYCPAELLPLTSTKSFIDAKINEMASAGNTHINTGLVWGWRVISPTEPFTEGHAYDDEEFRKAIVLMTDGENVMSSSVYSAYGYLSAERLGTSNSSRAIRRLNNRTTAVCNNIKAEGIIIYTITFQVSSNTVRNLMRGCASEPDNYFDSPSAAELQSAFRAIGQELSNLRIGR